MNIEDRILQNPKKIILKNTDTGEIMNFEIQDDPENVIQEGTKLNSSFFNECINERFPIGKVEVFYDLENHSNYMGLQWELCCSGRFPVGYSASDENFNAIGKTGGSKKHKHLSPIGFDDSNLFCDKSKLSNSKVYSTNVKITSNGSETTGNGRFAYTDEESALPPYEVFAFWRRKE